MTTPASEKKVHNPKDDVSDAICKYGESGKWCKCGRAHAEEEWQMVVLMTGMVYAYILKQADEDQNGDLVELFERAALKAEPEWHKRTPWAEIGQLKGPSMFPVMVDVIVKRQKTTD